MGREVRRVPLDWEHPVNEHPPPFWGPSTWDWTGQGRHFVPLFDETYDEAVAKLAKAREEWPSNPRSSEFTFEEWHGEMESPERYRPAWPADAVLGWQMYETVTEGTPVSPVFDRPEALAVWLEEEQGYSRAAAEAFVSAGWGPTFVTTGDGRMLDAVESAERMAP